MQDVTERRSVSAGWVFGGVFFLAVAVAVYFVAFHPVCEPIPTSELPVFESVKSLEERAANGEGFQKRNGRWHACKSPLARAFFF